jgi:hypothetical protein
VRRAGIEIDGYLDLMSQSACLRECNSEGFVRVYMEVMEIPSKE